MKLSLSKALFFLLVSLPITFKLKLPGDILVYPQELLIPTLFLFFLASNPGSISWPATTFIRPFYFLFGGLMVIVICTLISFFNFFSISGLLKTVKYLVYCFAVFLVSKYHFKKFVSVFINVGVATVTLTLLLYFYNFINSGVTIQEFYQRSMWRTDIMPTGFSNTYLNIPGFHFERIGGNHGIYGSYLILVYLALVGYTKHVKAAFNFKFWFKTILIFFNLALLTSREAFLIFLFVNLYLFKGSFSFRIKQKDFVIGFLVICSVAAYLITSDTQLVIFSKIQYTINSFLLGGEEGNISLRFNVWKLTLLSYLIFPLHLIIGYGYNRENYDFFLSQTNEAFNLHLNFPSVPESFFFFFLAYGGLISLFFSFLFFLGLVLKTFSIRKDSIFAGAFFTFTFMLFITNNTGGSMLSDLLFTQYSLVFIYLNKCYENN